MNDQQLKQRIAYLVEHGGIAEADPLHEVKRLVRLAVGLSCCALTVDVVLLALIMR